MLQAEITKFTGLCPLLREGHSRQAAVEFAYLDFDEHSDGRCEEHNYETGIEESIDDNNVLWRGEVARDICPKARITHHLRLIDEDVLYGVHRIRFETIEEFDEESAQETGK